MEVDTRAEMGENLNVAVSAGRRSTARFASSGAQVATKLVKF